MNPGTYVKSVSRRLHVRMLGIKFHPAKRRQGRPEPGDMTSKVACINITPQEPWFSPNRVSEGLCIQDGIHRSYESSLYGLRYLGFSKIIE